MRPGLSLFAQTLALVFAALVAAQLAAIAVVMVLVPPSFEFYTLKDVAAAVNGSPPPRRLERPLARHISLQPPHGRSDSWRASGFGESLAETLHLPRSSVMVTFQYARLSAFGVAPPRHPMPPPSLFEHDSSNPTPPLAGHFRVGIARPDGRWLIIEPQRPFGIDPWQLHVLLIFALASFAVTPLAWLFSRRLASPFAALAAGAQRLGRDPKSPALVLRGPSEVQAAVIAFNEMQRSLRRYVEDRTAMMAAIAHDLRTPLTRLRFRIDAAPEEQRAKMAADVDEMDAMVSAVLAFVRDTSGPEQRTPLDLASLVESVVDEAAETGADAQIASGDRVIVDGDALALKRLLSNLVDNAVKFGRLARVSVRAEADTAVVEIDDAGPGIPANQIERAFAPFSRLEGSRSRETGGTGLGLAIVRAVARAHGGDVTLHNRPQGGLRATLRLPMSPTKGY